MRFVDENIARVTAEEFAWADVVFVSGMHIQRHRIHDITRRAHDAGKVVALGGPSVSSASDYLSRRRSAPLRRARRRDRAPFPAVDEPVERPEEQIIFARSSACRCRISDAGLPPRRAARLSSRARSSSRAAVPITCEFCDIPSLYGRNPRLKTPEQVVARTRRNSPTAALFPSISSTTISSAIPRLPKPCSTP